MNFMNIGKNKAHVHAETDQKVTFKDAAGVDEAKQELGEVIEFLRNPDHFQRLGGHMPKGVLLAGAPGTGKTLLARAVSGEAGVPFFNISGSDFIEMFVGVGAARVRDLFEEARKKAPCIIFIDELDAIGRQRGGPVVMGGHDEREQTLNQLLVEMDGFDTSKGIVVISATNRPEVLDKALLRPGRFDRQIVVDKPDLLGRIDILKIHTGELILAPRVDLELVAKRTPGFVGADLANVANEAAILAARKNRDAVTTADFEAAIDRVIAGPEKKKSTLDPDEKHRVSYHESGHTLVARLVPTGEPVHKVSIIPRGIGALGYTQQLPEKEKFLATKNELLDQVAILLGGRVAEEIILGDVSTGAQNDLERASEMARNMVCSYGMSKKMGPLTFGKKQTSLFLGTEYGEERNYSDDTAREIDAEVKNIITTNYDRVKKLLQENRPLLDALAAKLEEKEVLTGEEVESIVKKS
jgi:cell division protease FtsH